MLILRASLDRWCRQKRVRKIVWLILFLLLGTAIVKGSVDLWKVLRWEIFGTMDPDVLDYFFVGRGMLNGLKLYVDLYESKPPAIFFLTILSLLTTGDERFLAVLQTLMYISLPAVFAGFAWREARTRNTPRRWKVFAICVAALLGLLFSLYIEERTGLMQTESWGAFCGILYMLSILWSGETHRTRIAVSSVLLFLTILFKEPFLLTTLAAALVASSSKKQFLKLFVLPLLFGGIAGVLLMLPLGYLGPYVTIHLPAMLSGRVAKVVSDPVWLRWLSIRWLFENLTQYYQSAPLFGYLMVFFFCMVPLVRVPVQKASTIFFTLMGSCALLLTTFYVYFIVLIFNILMHGSTVSSNSHVGRIVLFPFFACLCVGLPLVLLQFGRSQLRYTILALAGLMLSSQAVGISVYTTNHFAFAVPYYAALAALFVISLLSEHRRMVLWLPATLLLLFIVFTYRTTDEHFTTLAEQSGYTYARQKPLVDRIDALMDACHYEQYYTVIDFQRFAFTKHSSTGPMVVLSYVNYLPPNHPLIQNTLNNILDRTSLLIAGSGNYFLNSSFDPSFDALIRERFTNQIPPCASPFLPIDSYTFLFKKDNIP